MKPSMKIAIGSDHGGFELKEQLIPYLKSLGHQIHDLGTHSKDPVDYPKFAHAVASQVAAGAADIGIVIDGAGIGSAMTANKVRGVLAAACYNEALAKNAREHNNANVLTLGAGQIDLATAKQIANVFLTTDCTADRHLARVKMIRELEGRAMSAGEIQLSPDDVQRIADRVKQLLGSPGGPAGDIARPLSADQVAKLIDHTLLRAEATPADIEKLCAEARTYGFWSVCVNSAYVKQAKALLRESGVKVCAVVGFPLGAMEPQIKALEARKAIRDGANEIDMVINIGALKAKDDATVLRDIRGVVESCKESRAKCKVILETSLLNEEEKIRACLLSMKAGADFVKTSTGFSSGGATAEDVALMARTVAPRKLGVKASGGIRTYADVVKMVNAGATRIGCSNSVMIMEEARTGVAQQAGGKGY
jgi:deoxyribose-phosphate aldolase